MKKGIRFLLVFWSIVLLIIGYVMANIHIIRPLQLKELSNHFEIEGVPYKFGEKMNNLDLTIVQNEEWEERNWYDHEVSYYNKEIGYIAFYGYPDYSDEYRFAMLKTENAETSIFGIKVGSGAGDVRKILKRWGYKEKEDGAYLKGKIRIGFGYDSNQKVNFISVTLNSSDWYHKGYYK